MDAPRFDDLTRALAQTGWTRRATARALAGAVLVPVFSFAADETAAKKRKKRKKKRGKSCATGEVACGNACVELQTDPDHCGGCGKACDPGETCVGGVCNRSGCAPDEIDCGGGVCIPDRDDACCVPLDCGPSRSGNEIACNLSTRRCECSQPGWGICSPRASDNGAFCAPCCPGGDEGCGRDLVCRDSSVSGCGCPPAMPAACPSPGMAGFCSQNLQTDSRRCGQFCEDCTRGGTAFACCVDGQCVGLAGCGPNTSSSSCFNSHCGTCGAVCGGDTPMCCNTGLGTNGRCVAPAPSGSCPP